MEPDKKLRSDKLEIICEREYAVVQNMTKTKRASIFFKEILAHLGIMTSIAAVSGFAIGGPDHAYSITRNFLTGVAPLAGIITSLQYRTSYVHNMPSYDQYREDFQKGLGEMLRTTKDTGVFIINSFGRALEQAFCYSAIGFLGTLSYSSKINIYKDIAPFALTGIIITLAKNFSFWRSAQKYRRKLNY